MTKPDTSIRQERRWQFWANAISKYLKWPHCTGMIEYLVCDRSDKKNGKLEMVDIYNRTPREIWKQADEILKNRRKRS